MAMTKPQKAAVLMEHLCTCSKHGYSQYSRAGDGTIEIVKVDGEDIAIAGGDRDCSKGTLSCYEALGVDCGGASYTGNMRSCMVKSGNFKAIKRPTSYSAQPGDIYLAEGKHAAMCISPAGSSRGDLLGQFSISENGTIDGKEGDQTGQESNIRKFYEYPWTHTIVYTGGGSVSEPSTSASRFGDRNWWGTKIAREFVSQLTGGTDSFLSDQTKANREYFWAVSGGVEYGGGSDGSAAVTALQAGLVTAGYSVGASGADGAYGHDTIEAHQRWLKDAGYYAGAVDGYHGTQTNTAVCAALEAGAYKGLV